MELYENIQADLNDKLPLETIYENYKGHSVNDISTCIVSYLAEDILDDEEWGAVDEKIKEQIRLIISKKYFFDKTFFRLVLRTLDVEIVKQLVALTDKICIYCHEFAISSFNELCQKALDEEFENVMKILPFIESLVDDDSISKNIIKIHLQNNKIKGVWRYFSHDKVLVYAVKYLEKSILRELFEEFSQDLHPDDFLDELIKIIVKSRTIDSPKGCCGKVSS